jgi:hypothetical protein
MIDPTGQWPSPTHVTMIGLRLRRPEPIQHSTPHGATPWPPAFILNNKVVALVVVLPVWVLALFIADLGKLAKPSYSSYGLNEQWFTLDEQYFMELFVLLVSSPSFIKPTVNNLGGYGFTCLRWRPTSPGATYFDRLPRWRPGVRPTAFPKRKYPAFRPSVLLCFHKICIINFRSKFKKSREVEGVNTK